VGFKKFQILAQNLKGSAFDFTEKRQIATKIDRDSVFHGLKAQISDRLHIMVFYIIFMGFKKIKFWLKIQTG
jgi:hypothetical protein